MKPKQEPWETWRKVLKNPCYVLAPMVKLSDITWRELARAYSTDLCYTPMFHAGNFATSQEYRAKHFVTCENDNPLVVQFCGNDPAVILEAAKHVQNKCAAIDINLGCPQKIAKRGHYGAFLQDEWELIQRIIETLVSELEIPISCKIRVFPEKEKTLCYAKMLEKAGCSFLCVHGRTREQIGHQRGSSDWSIIREVREALSIPVIANGDLKTHEDVQNCLEVTGAAAVMAAHGQLYNPQLFCSKPERFSFFLERYFKHYNEQLARNIENRFFSREQRQATVDHLLKHYKNNEAERERLLGCKTEAALQRAFTHLIRRERNSETKEVAKFSE